MSGQPEKDVSSNLISLLRGRPNPFDSLVRSRLPDDEFADVHVEAVLRDKRELLLSVIDVYRMEEYASLTDLPGSRVVAVVGRRGAGKTHMLESLSHRADGKRQLLIRRQSGCDSARSFDEHVTFEIVRALTTQDPVYKTCLFDELAPYVTRLVLERALCSLSPTDRLCFSSGNRWSRWRLAFGGARTTLNRFHRLQDDIDQREPAALASTAKEHGVSIEALLQLIETHLRVAERGKHALSRMRRQLYLACARRALKNDGAALDEFIEGDFDAEGAIPRDELISELRNAVVELCALFQRPIVLAYDNFEAFLAPRGVFDEEAARAFTSGLAQAVDAGPGLLFLLFVADDMFRELMRVADTFAKDRFYQGVPVPRHGAVDRIELQPPTRHELQALIRCRVAKLLEGMDRPDQLPEIFPFSPIVVEQLAEKRGQVLRGTLIGLREAWPDAVDPQRPRDVPPSLRAAAVEEVAAPRIDLAIRWKAACFSAAKELRPPYLAHAERLHVGLGKLLTLAGRLPEENWSFEEVKPIETFGDDPRYGIATLVSCRALGGDDAPETTAPVRVAISFLLTRGLPGRGQPDEMRQKLAIFDYDAINCRQLILLRAGETRSDDCASELPSATGSLLQQSPWRARVVCRGLPEDDLRALLTIPAWLESIAENDGVASLNGQLATFLSQSCRSLLRLLRPNSPAKSKERDA